MQKSEPVAAERKAEDTSPSKRWGCGSLRSSQRDLWLNADLKGLETENTNKHRSPVLPFPTAATTEKNPKSYRDVCFWLRSGQKRDFALSPWLTGQLRTRRRSSRKERSPQHAAHPRLSLPGAAPLRPQGQGRDPDPPARPRARPHPRRGRPRAAPAAPRRLRAAAAPPPAPGSPAAGEGRVRPGQGGGARLLPPGGGGRCRGLPAVRDGRAALPRGSALPRRAQCLGRARGAAAGAAGLGAPLPHADSETVFPSFLSLPPSRWGQAQPWRGSEAWGVAGSSQSRPGAEEQRPGRRGRRGAKGRRWGRWAELMHAQQPREHRRSLAGHTAVLLGGGAVGSCAQSRFHSKVRKETKRMKGRKRPQRSAARRPLGTGTCRFRDAAQEVCGRNCQSCCCLLPV